MIKRLSVILPILALGACSTPGGPYPSLAPRAAEAIDPRVPVDRPINNRPATAGLVGRLAALIDQAQAGQSDFAPLAAKAEQLASKAGSAKSEGWIVAQQALSAAVAARKRTATAMGDVDALAAEALATNGGIAPNDLAAIQRAQAEVGSIDRDQANRISAIQSRLGI